MLGISADGRPGSLDSLSRRRAHSPAATRTKASSAPSVTRTPGPMSPCWIVYRTRNMPPSASATPPTHTTHRVPNRSSKPIGRGGAGEAAGTDGTDAGPGCCGGGCGGGGGGEEGREAGDSVGAAGGGGDGRGSGVTAVA